MAVDSDWDEFSDQLAEPADAAAELLRRKAARKCLNTYAMERGYWPSPHQQVINAELTNVVRGKVKNLIIIAWPGAAKSTYVSQLFPAWAMTQEHWGGPKRRWDILATSHNADLAEQFSFQVRRHVQDDDGVLEYTIAPDSKAVDEWRTTSGHAYRAFGIMAGITGRRADLALGDDWVKNTEQADSPTAMKKLWRAYLNDFSTRLKPDGAKIIIMTHWSQADPIGMILPTTWKGESGDIVGRDGVVWRVVRLAAMWDGDPTDPLGRTEIDESGWPEWCSTEQFRQMRETLVTGGEQRTWTACYQGVPSPESGTFFKREFFQYFDTLPPGCRFMVTSDFAVSEDEKADHIVHGLWAIDYQWKLYLIDVWRRRASLEDDGINAALDMIIRGSKMGDMAAWVNETGVIKKALGGAIRTKMQQRKVYVEQVDYTRAVDKRSFASSIKSRYASGGVLHARGAAWVPAYEDELLRFMGGGAEDDQVDMAALAGRHMVEVIAPPEDTGQFKMQGPPPGSDRMQW